MSTLKYILQLSVVIIFTPGMKSDRISVEHVALACNLVITQIFSNLNIIPFELHRRQLYCSKFDPKLIYAKLAYPIHINTIKLFYSNLILIKIYFQNIESRHQYKLI